MTNGRQCLINNKDFTVCPCQSQFPWRKPAGDFGPEIMSWKKNLKLQIRKIQPEISENLNIIIQPIHSFHISDHGNGHIFYSFDMSHNCLFQGPSSHGEVLGFAVLITFLASLQKSARRELSLGKATVQVQVWPLGCMVLFCRPHPGGAAVWCPGRVCTSSRCLCCALATFYL